jgi:hypothetical protein
MKLIVEQDEGRKRIRHYPSVEKQLDAIWDILLDPKNNGVLDYRRGQSVVDKIKDVRQQFKKKP